jgi:hypothetical protein
VWYYATSSTVTWSSFYFQAYGLNISSSNVSVGSSILNYPLAVTGTGTSTAAPYSNLAFQATSGTVATAGYSQAYAATGSRPIKIYTDGNIGCAELDLFSDKRIKEDISDLDGPKAIELMAKFKVREFSYKDKVEYGPCRYPGFIAQEVQEIFPEAVRTHEGVVPDVFKMAQRKGDSWKLETDTPLEAGDSLKVIDEGGIKKVKVISFSNSELKIDNDLEGDNVFMYGKYVTDFHTVSYDRLFPVLLCAFQELVKTYMINKNGE